MPLFGRPDGELVRDAPVLRRLMPYLMPKRADATVFFEQDLDVTKTLAFLEGAQREGEGRLTFFHVVLWGVIRTLAARPQMHRFVVGGRLYQRKTIELSFAVKKRMADDATMTTVKVAFEPGDDLRAVARRVDQSITQGRSLAPTSSEKEMKLVTMLPGFLMRFVFAAQRWLDGHNLLPSAMIRPDPLYASMFLANLGSVGLDAPFHHLYEYGTIPLFTAIGRIRQEPSPEGTRDRVRLRYTFDERIADGFYCARSLDLFRELVEDPAAGRALAGA